MFKPSKSKNPELWKIWKALRDSEQKIRQIIVQFEAAKFNTADMCVVADSIVDEMNKVGRKIEGI